MTKAKRTSSEKTTILATYAARHEAEVAKSFLADQGIDAFIVADDVHVSLQYSDGARVVVLERRAEEAYQALSEADLLPESFVAAEGPEDAEDEE